MLQHHELPLTIDPGIEALAENMDEYGQTTPVVVDAQTNWVLDGARRIRALLRIGQTHVMVVTATSLSDACEQVRIATLEHPPAQGDVQPGDGVDALKPNGERLYRLSRDLRPLVQLRTRTLKARRIGLKRTEHVEPETPARDLVSQALGFGPGIINAVIAVYKTWESLEDPEMKALMSQQIDLMNKGIITPYTARGFYERIQRGQMTGSITDAAAQLETFATLRAQLGGVVRGVAQVGEINAKVSTVELDKFINSFEDAIRELRHFTKILKKRAETR